MDRFEWLKCQSWLVPCSTSAAAAAVDWCFEGFASFYTSFHGEENEALSENTAHLFFSDQAPSLDPAQFALKLGVAHQGIQMLGSDIVLSFDNGSCYYLDFKQVLAILKWEQEQGCKTCKESNYLPAGARRENACACQLLPLYVSVKLKHVSMIIYPRNQSIEGCLPQTLGAIDVLCKAFEEKEVSKCHGAWKIGSASCNSEKTANLSSAYSSSKRIMQQFLTKLDCMSECVLAATNGCNADVPRMIRLLHIMMQHVAAHKERSLLSKPLQCQLQSILFSLEDEEQRQMSSIWANGIQQQEAKAGAVIALQRTIEKVYWLKRLRMKEGTCTFNNLNGFNTIFSQFVFGLRVLMLKVIYKQRRLKRNTWRTQCPTK